MTDRGRSIKYHVLHIPLPTQTSKFKSQNRTLCVYLKRDAQFQTKYVLANLTLDIPGFNIYFVRQQSGPECGPQLCVI